MVQVSVQADRLFLHAAQTHTRPSEALKLSGYL